MAEAEALATAEKYEEAKAKFVDAAKIKPDETMPQKRIDEINAKLKEISANEALEMYNKIIAQADKDFDAGNYVDAKSYYERALTIRPTDPHPKNRIDEINAKAAKNTAYKEAIKKADAEFNAGKYEASIPLYEAAGKIIPDETYPPQQIELAKSKINELKDEQARKDALEKEYQALIKDADAAFKANDFDNAVAKYTEAQAKKPSETYPKAQIDAINAKRNLLQADKEYADLMAKGDADLAVKNYDGAIASYKEAKGKKPAEKQPDIKIAEAQKLKDADAANAANQAKAEELRKKYEAKMAEAEALATAEKYEEAKAKFVEAANIKPDETMPQKRIDEINAKLKEISANEALEMYNKIIAQADKDFDAGNYTDAKGYYERALKIRPTDAHPKNRIDEINAKSAKNTAYQEAIKKADAEFNAGKYEASIPLYEAAGKIIPDEVYPPQQIEKAKAKLNELKDEQARKDALEKEYQALIKDADAAFKANDFDNAVAKYTEAQAKKPSETYPKTQIDAINAKRNLLQADKEYADLMAKGDADLAAKNYDGAIASYKEAKGKKPAEKQPDIKIAEAQKLKDADAANAANQAKAEELRKKYEAKMAEAEALATAEKYEEAKAQFIEAAKIKPDETMPQKRIDEINAKLKEVSANEALEMYNKIIAQADKDFDAGNYTDAKGYYERALKIRPTDAHPKNRIDEINKKLADQLAGAEKQKKFNEIVKRADAELKKADYDKSIASYKEALAIMEDDYPKTKIAEAEELKRKAKEDADAKARYLAEFNNGMTSFNGGDHNKALIHFQNALDAKPGDKEATEMLEKVKANLKEKEEFKENQYNLAIKLGDENFNGSKWDDAEAMYKRALGIKPNEAYPKAQLDEIKKKRGAATDAGEYNKIIAEANIKFNKKDYSSARDLYMQASNLQPNIPYPKNKIKEIDDLLNANNSGGSNNNNAQQVQVKPNGGNTVETYYGVETNLDVTAAQELMRQVRIEDENKRTQTSEEEKLNSEKLLTTSGESQDERRAENDQKLSEKENKQDEFGEDGEKLREDNVDGYANLKEQREVSNSGLSGDRNVYLAETGEKYEQMKTEFQETAVGTDSIRLENIDETKTQKENIYTTESKLEGETQERRADKSEELTQNNYQLQDQLAGTDVVRQEKHENLAEFKETRYETETALEGETQERRAEKSDELTQNNYQLQDQLAGTDVVRQDKEQNISEFKEERANNETKLEGETQERRAEKSEELTQNNYQLQDQLAGTDVVRQDKEQNLSEFKEERANNETKLEGETQERRAEKSEELTQNNYQLQDQLAGTDVVRQDKEQNISEFKEERANNETKLEGETQERRAEKSEELTQNNFQLQDQLAGTDVVRQEKHENLSEFKETRYNSETALEGETQERRAEKSDELTENNYQLQDQLAGTDVVRQEKEQNLSEFKEERANNETKLEGETQERRAEKSDELTQNNYQLQDQLAGTDVVRQDKEQNLSEFKEERANNETKLEGETQERRAEKSDELTENNYQLQDQLAGTDVVRQEKHQNLQEFKEVRDVTNSSLSGNSDDKTQATKDTLVAQNIEREKHAAEMGQNTEENIDKLKADQDMRNLKEEENATHGDAVRSNNQEKLENTKYKENDPRAGNKRVLISEKSYRIDDSQGRPLETNIVRTVQEGDITYTYVMKITRTGTSFFKNGKPISETQWSVETGAPKQ
jgi:tetratricopeptide (TPR) repeat protein